MTAETFRCQSSGGGAEFACFAYLPEGEPRAIIQIAHGMIDHTGRYLSMIRALTDAGYAVFSCDHLGHGKTAEAKRDFGYFGPRGARETVVTDLHEVTKIAKERLPARPVILIGHSMGSFLVRMYATRYGDELAGLAILGTGGPNPALPAGILLADLVTLFCGPRFRSRLLGALAFSGYTKPFGEDAPPEAWLSRDPAVGEAYRNDPLCHFRFTSSAYRELFGMTQEVNRRGWAKALPAELKVLLASGTMDPVGGFGRGVNRVAERLRSAIGDRLTMHLYPDARHELHNETNREEFFTDLIAWINGVIG